ncbi:hypothetical protein [Parasphingorhabdus sp.]|uniref:hypothetical protein n=1 Tax=Parasphingorhabdus sp. TaxID=2709688 RepID=UPI00300190E3
MKRYFLLVPALVLAAPLSAQSENTAETAETGNADDPMQKIKCRRLAVTGSLVKRQKVCRTLAQWADIGRNGNKQANDIVDQANQGHTRGN